MFIQKNHEKDLKTPIHMHGQIDHMNCKSRVKYSFKLGVIHMSPRVVFDKCPSCLFPMWSSFGVTYCQTMILTYLKLSFGSTSKSHLANSTIEFFRLNLKI